MWLDGFGLAVLCYWRHAGALNAFGLVPQEVGVVHAASRCFSALSLARYSSRIRMKSSRR
ncbi:hypothetical protein EA154_14770 [Enterobacter hormaechei subsp. hoffmannii]|nr:hypothetical protein EA154_14770 [Enterobacter hormaechei subsp. hoffmannii]